MKVGDKVLVRESDSFIGAGVVVRVIEEGKEILMDNNGIYVFDKERQDDFGICSQQGVYVSTEGKNKRAI